MRLLLILAVVVAQGALLYAHTPSDTPYDSLDRRARSPDEDECMWSKEAKRVNLAGVLRKIKQEYYKNNRHMASTNDEIDELQVKRQFMPYVPSAKNLKRNADAAREQLRMIRNLPANKTLLKPRESRLVHQFQYFLEANFDNIYDRYYDGVFMLGPDYFCEQAICFINNHFLATLQRVKLRTRKDLEKIVYWVEQHEKTFTEYVKNAKAGVEAGMVQPIEVCKSAARTISKLYGQVAKHGAKNSLKFKFAKTLLGSEVEKNISQLQIYRDLKFGVMEDFQRKFGVSYEDKLRKTIVEKFGEPLKEMITYFQKEHVQYCPPSDVSSGLGGLPLKYQYKDGAKQEASKTTGNLPDGTPANVTEGYRNLMRYYTTSDMTGKEATKLGYEKIETFYKEVLALGKDITGKETEEEIVKEFKKKLEEDELFYNKEDFPEEESNDDAHENCDNDIEAERNCPKRWAAIQRWFKHNVKIMGDAKPYVKELFYTHGNNKTTPDCLVRLTAEYNPSNGVPSYLESDRDCMEPASYFVPFFKKKMGPSYEDFNTNFHEARPGHHLQIQGFMENFEDFCGDISSWINDVVDYYPSFSEGWGLYAENPILLYDTDIIKDNKLARYGALKWQIWRALRLIADVGFHEGNMSRDEILKLFKKYTWDESDTVVKEITRYQGTPGQATSYMIGQQTIVAMRDKVKEQLGVDFDIKEFHFQLLRQGQSPFDFITKYMQMYVKCKQDKKNLPFCSLVLNPTNGEPLLQQAIIGKREKEIRQLFRLFKLKKHA